ncbi:hypothetical protein KOW79_010970 [Hemibagrus wyckioides]|uniref:Uncharacterized protein n=1 Tax=Hemibagrus wyckioides TaxID=337641 RepID=A0A9D3SJJ3_9TELE|nr:hypothetical protein KOW79_010970 [Hemibagrus wyckioides]
MTILFLTLVLALMLMSGSSLKCNRCFTLVGEKCKSVPEPCLGEDACVSSVMKKQSYLNRSLMKRCIRMAECLRLKKNPDFKERKAVGIKRAATPKEMLSALECPIITLKFAEPRRDFYPSPCYPHHYASLSQYQTEAMGKENLKPHEKKIEAIKEYP